MITSEWPKKFDSIVGVVGLVTSVVIYYVQSRSAPTIDFLIVILPTILASMLIGTHWASSVLKVKFDELKTAKRFYDEITGIKCRLVTTVRILNEEGDTTYDRWVRYEIIKSKIQLQETDVYQLGSTGPLNFDDLPACSIESSVHDIKISPVSVFKGHMSLQGKDFHKHVWRYRFDPPLSGKRTYVSFRFQTELPECEKDAFTKEGSVLCVQARATNADMTMILIVPSAFQLVLLETYFEDENGGLEEIAKESAPNLADNREVLHWAPRYKSEGRYICRYRVLKK